MSDKFLATQTTKKGDAMKRLAGVLVLLAATTSPMVAHPAHAQPACIGPSGGVPYTPGFWSNKHGRAAIGSDDLAVLNFLNLVDANGNAFDPANFDTFRAWLLAGNAVNMAYMLSVQLAAAELNVFNGAVSGSALIYAPGTNSADVNGFATLNSIIIEANLALGADSFTPAGDANRAYQEALKNALDAANNDTNYLQPNCL